MAVTDPDAGRARHLDVHGARRRRRASVLGAPEHKMGIKGPRPTRGALLRRTFSSADDRLVGPPGTGPSVQALRTLDHTRPTIAAQAVGRRPRPPWTSPSATSKEGASSSAVPSPSFQGLQFMLAGHGHGARRRSTHDVRRLPLKAEARRLGCGRTTQPPAKTFASDTAMKVTTDAVQLARRDTATSRTIPSNE